MALWSAICHNLPTANGVLWDFIPNQQNKRPLACVTNTFSHECYGHTYMYSNEYLMMKIYLEIFVDRSLTFDIEISWPSSS